MSAQPEIIPISGEPFRVFVESRTRPGMLHLADVEADACSCEHDQFRIEPLRWRGKSYGRCKHLQAARDFVLDRLLKEITREALRNARQWRKSA